MANGAFNFKDSNGNIVSFISGSGSDIIMSGGTLNLSSMTSLTLGNLTMEGTVETASFAPNYLLTSSFETYSGDTNNIVESLQTTSSSLNEYTASNNIIIGSLQTSTSSLNTFTSSVTTRLNSIEDVSGSYATTGSNQFKSDQAITGSLTVTGFIEAQELRTTYISSSILYRSGSTKFGDELTDTHAFTGSVLISGSLSVPTSNLVSGSSQIDVLSTTNIARIATTGSNTFVGNQVVSGSITTTNEIYIDNGNYLRFKRSSGGLSIQTLGIPSGTDDVRLLTTGNFNLINGSLSNLLSITNSGTATFSNDVVIANGKFLQAARNTGGALIDIIGIQSGSDTLQIKGGTSGGLNAINFYDTGGQIATFYNSNFGIGVNTPFSKLTVNGVVSAINGGVDGTFSDAFVGVYSSNNNEQNAIQTTVSSVAQSSGFRFQVSNGGGSSGRTTVADFKRDRQIFYTNVGIGTDSPNVKLEVLDTATSSGEVARFQRNLDQINEYAYIKVGNASYPGYFGSILSTYDMAYMSMSPNPADGKALTIRTTDGFVGVGTLSPASKLDVAGNIKNSTRVYSGNAITGNISTNLLSGNGINYILVCDLNDIAGFSLNGYINAASYTTWNISSFYIIKNYSSTSSSAGITGLYKGGGCDMNIVDLNYGSGRYLAIGYTSNPEIDVIWTGYRLLHMFNGDGSATVVPQSNVTINSTLATY